MKRDREICKKIKGMERVNGSIHYYNFEINKENKCHIFKIGNIN